MDMWCKSHVVGRHGGAALAMIEASRVLRQLRVSGSFPHVEYEWDEQKATVNFAKHGVSFTAAARALEDPRRVELVDDRYDYGEERIQTLGMDQGRILFVATTMPDENVCRIISARKATRHEQEKYLQGGPLFS